MENQAPRFFNGEGRTGRFFLSPYHLMEAKHGLEIVNSQVKRGERTPLCGSWKQHAWGCGCCVNVLETAPQESYDENESRRLAEIYRKPKMRRRGFFEMNGQRLKSIVLPNGSIVLA